MGKIIFRLTIEGKTPSTWEIPQSNVMGIKGDKGKKFINYYPGEDSCFVEDIFAKNKDLKPKKVPLFKFNSQSGATELQVDETNIALVNYLKTHPWFGLNFNIFSKDKQAKEDLAQFDNVEKALDLIKNSDEDKIKAIAMAIFGLGSFYKTYHQCAAELKSKAIKEPKVVINTLESDDYQTKYVAGLALVSGIIKINNTHTAIVWTENEGVILHIAQGESGLDKLAEFLRKSTAESEVLLQEFQARLDKKLKSKSVENNYENQLSEKDKEIARLRELLNNPDIQVPQETKPVTEDVAGDATKVTETSLTEEEKQKELIKDAQEKYLVKFGKEAPAAYKTKLDWLNSKLQE